MICPGCKGKKQNYCHVNYGPGKGGEWKFLDCSRCSGTGEISDEFKPWVEEGERLRAERIAAGKSVHDAASAAGVDGQTYIKMERGKIKPHTLP